MEVSEIVGQISRAANLIYNPATTNNERKQAQEFLESMKEDVRCPLIGYQLARFDSNQSETIRFLGLGFIEHAIRHKWAARSYSDSERQHIKELVGDLLVNGLSPNGEPPFIKEKVAMILAELAEREWPQRWPELDRYLISMASSSKLHLHIAVMILRHLAEDVFAFPNPVTINRKEDLRGALIAILSRAPVDLAVYQRKVDDRGFPVIHSGIPVDLYELCGIELGNEGWISRILNILSRSDIEEYIAIACIDALGAIVEWIPFDLLSQSKLSQNLFLLLQHSSISVQRSACESLVILSGRTFSDWNQAKEIILDPLLSEEALQILNTAWTRNNGAATTSQIKDLDRHLTDEYPFLKRLAQFWSDIGIHHLCHKKAESVHHNLPRYLQIILQLTKHDSFTIASIAVHSWLVLIKSEIIAKSSDLLAIMEQLFEAIVVKLNKFPVIPRDFNDEGEDADDEYSIPLSNRYSYLDYEEREEFQVAFGAFRSQCYTVIKFIAAQKSLFCLQGISQLLHFIITEPPSSPQTSKRNRNNAGLLNTNSRLYCSWDMAVCALHSVLAYVKRSDEVKLLAMQTFHGLMGYEHCDPLIVGRQLDALASFTPFIGQDENQLALALLQKLFTFVVFTLPNEAKIVDDSWIVTEDTRALRRKACASLLKITPDMGELLFSIFPDIKREIGRLVDQNLITPGEHASLEEFKTSIIYYSRLSPEQKFGYYNEIFEANAIGLVSDDMKQLLSDPNVFGDSIGLRFLSKLYHPDAKANLQSIKVPRTSMSVYRKTRSHLNFLLNSYKSCLGRSVRINNIQNQNDRRMYISSSPWAVNLSKILPVVLNLIKNFHSLWIPEHLTDIHPEMRRQFLDISTAEKHGILGKAINPLQVSPEECELETLADEIKRLQNWIRLFRETLYGLIGHASYLVPGEEFYGIPMLSKIILSDAFHGVTHISNHGWKALLGMLARPLILNCPKIHFVDVLQPIAPPLLTFIWQKLDHEWKEIIRKGTFIGTLEEAEISASNEDEMARNDNESGNDAKSDEADMLHQKTLRDLTRNWSDLMSHLFLSFVPEPSPSKGKLAAEKTVVTTDFGLNDDLTKFMLSSEKIAEPLLYGLVASLGWKDTKTCSISTRSLTKIVPFLMKNQAFHAFIAQDVLVAVLKALHDGYHQEGHDFLILLATDIYILTKPVTNLAAETLACFIPRFNAAEFNQKIMNESRSTNQRKIMKECLREIIGVKMGQWHNKPLGSSGSLLRLLPEKMLLQSAKSAKKHDFEETLDDSQGAGLFELFGGGVYGS